MSTLDITLPLRTARLPLAVRSLATLARRRFQLTARTPRELLVPLLTPIMFALVIAPALETALHTGSSYASFVAVARGIHFHATGTGVLWFLGAGVLFTVGMYGLAEILASRVPRQEEYIARVPAIAILPWFLAGALFPLVALPSFLTWVAKFLPLTHGLALMRYGLLQDSTGLHAIWGLSDQTAMAALSLAVVGGFALLLTAASIRVFSRSAVR